MKARLRAFLIHLTLSSVTALVVFALFWWVWYPQPMFVALDAHQVFLLLIGVDVVAGPLLTLAVFKPGKPSLRFDLTCIALFQIVALAYGLSTLLEARPVYIAALGDRFQVIQATEVTDENLKKAGVALPLWGPQWVGTKAPVDDLDAATVRYLAEIGAGRGHLPQLHIPYAQMASEVLRQSRPISDLLSGTPERSVAIRDWLRSRGYRESDVRFQPFLVAGQEFVVVVKADSGAVAGVAPIKL